MSKKSKSTALILGVILAALFGVIWVTSRPNVVQGDEDLPPPPDTPDPTIEAYYAQLPDCCDDENPVYVTLPPIELTANAPPPEVTQPASSTLTAAPPLVYLAPSDDWVIYTDLTYGYSFRYPANWHIYQDKKWAAITNFRFDQVGKTSIEDTRPFRVNIYQAQDFGTYSSLEDYVLDQQQLGDPSIVLSQRVETLTNGYQVLWQEKTAVMPPEVLVVYITNGKQVYNLIGPSLKSQYLYLMNDIVNSFVIP
jgi:hypothetical protein